MSKLWVIFLSRRMSNLFMYLVMILNSKSNLRVYQNREQSRQRVPSLVVSRYVKYENYAIL